MQPVAIIDRSLNKVTMYVLMRLGLATLATVALVYSFLGLLPTSAGWLAASLVVLLATAEIANRLCAIVAGTVANADSSIITGFILFFVLPPANDASGLGWLMLGAVIAVGSKYVLAWHSKHLFNPVALGAFALTATGAYAATWWIGTPLMLPFVVVFGLLIARKVRRFIMLGAFMLASFVGVVAVALAIGASIPQLLAVTFITGPLVYFASVMLTEPSTMPARLTEQVVFAAVVGVLAVSRLDFGFVTMSSLLALLIGNAYAFATNYAATVRLKLVRRDQLSPRVFDYVFAPNRPLQFQAGQYMDWTMPVSRPDLRGNRRTFTIASAPSESEVHLGVKTYEPSSAYKKSLGTLKVGDMIMGNRVGGDFVLPRDTGAKLVFVAGGIGVTPFRSMVKEIMHSGQKRDVVLLYVVSDVAELSFEEIFRSAEPLGLRYVPILSSQVPDKAWKGHIGPVTPDLLRQLVPDYAERTFYVSGPSPMVDSYRAQFKSLGLKNSQVKADHFSGY